MKVAVDFPKMDLKTLSKFSDFKELWNLVYLRLENVTLFGYHSPENSKIHLEASLSVNTDEASWLSPMLDGVKISGDIMNWIDSLDISLWIPPTKFL